MALGAPQPGRGTKKKAPGPALGGELEPPPPPPPPPPGGGFGGCLVFFFFLGGGGGGELGTATPGGRAHLTARRCAHGNGAARLCAFACVCARARACDRVRVCIGKVPPKHVANTD